MFKMNITKDTVTPYLEKTKSKLESEKTELFKLIFEQLKSNANVPVEVPQGDYEVGFLKASAKYTIVSTGEISEAVMEYSGRDNPTSNRLIRREYTNFSDFLPDKDYALFQHNVHNPFLSEAISKVGGSGIEQVVGAEYIKLLRSNK